jgi:hypothetical protein
MSAFAGEADIIQGKPDIKKCPLMTQSGHCLNISAALRHLLLPPVRILVPLLLVRGRVPPTTEWI